MKGVQLRADTRAAVVREIIQRQRSLEQIATELCVDIPTLLGWIEEYVADSRFALETRAREVLVEAGIQTGTVTDLEFSGSLDQMAFPDVLQLMILHRRSCIVKVGCSTGTGTVWLRDGDVFDAEFEDLVGERAFFALLSLRQGTFRVLFQVEDRIRSIHRGTQALILEAAKRADEAGELQERMGGAAQVFARSDRSLLDSAQLRPQDMKTLTLFDAKRNVDEVLRISPHDEFATLTQVTRLIEEGYLIPSSIKPVAVSAPLVSQRVFSRASLILGEAPSSLAGVTAVAAPTVAPAVAPKPRVRTSLKVMSGLSALVAVFAAYVDAKLRAPYPTGIEPVRTSVAAAQHIAAAESNTPSSSKPSLTAASVCPADLLHFAGGDFKMGTNSNLPALRLARPEHSATVAAFCLSPTEVTVAQYQSCVDAGKCLPAKDVAYWSQGPLSKKAWTIARRVRSTQCNTGKPGRGEHPVNCVSFDQAKSYCAAQGQRLPREAEWEFAARGNEGRLHPWGLTPPSASLANVCGAECEIWHRGTGLLLDFAGTMYPEDDGFSGTSPIAQLKAGATPEGAFDLTGNVSEWTNDAPSEYPNAASQARNDESAVHMIRGASFASGPVELSEAAFRFAVLDNTHSPSIGFRCAADPQK